MIRGGVRHPSPIRSQWKQGGQGEKWRQGQTGWHLAMVDLVPDCGTGYQEKSASLSSERFCQPAAATAGIGMGVHQAQPD